MFYLCYLGTKERYCWDVAGSQFPYKRMLSSVNCFLSISSDFTSMFSKSSTVDFITTAFLVLFCFFFEGGGLFFFACVYEVPGTCKCNKNIKKHHCEFPTHGLQEEVDLFLEGHHLGIKFKTTRKPRDHRPIQLARAQIWQSDWSQGAQMILCHFPKAQETKRAFHPKAKKVRGSWRC